MKRKGGEIADKALLYILSGVGSQKLSSSIESGVLLQSLVALEVCSFSLENQEHVGTTRCTSVAPRGVPES